MINGTDYLKRTGIRIEVSNKQAGMGNKSLKIIKTLEDGNWIRFPIVTTQDDEGKTITTRFKANISNASTAVLIEFGDSTMASVISQTSLNLPVTEENTFNDFSITSTISEGVTYIVLAIVTNYTIFLDDLEMFIQ